MAQKYMAISPLAGKPAPKELLVDLARLEREYYERRPDLAIPPSWSASAPAAIAARRCSGTFTEAHILAITQAICDYRREPGHRRPAVHGQGHARAVRAGAAHGARSAGGQRRRDASSSATTASRRRRSSRARSSSTTAAAREHLADGIVITPSHNPPEDGGFKYNPPNGGPADTDVTRVDPGSRQRPAARGQRGVKRVPLDAALRGGDHARRRTWSCPTSRTCANVIDMEAIRAAGLKLGVDPLGGAAVHYWEPINERLRARHHGREPGGRSDLLVHDGRSRRQDPHGLLQPLRDGAAGRAEGPVSRRLRQRSGRRPARHRHAARRA